MFLGVWNQIRHSWLIKMTIINTKTSETSIITNKYALKALKNDYLFCPLYIIYIYIRCVVKQEYTKRNSLSFIHLDFFLFADGGVLSSLLDSGGRDICLLSLPTLSSICRPSLHPFSFSTTTFSFLTPWPWAWPLQVLCIIFFCDKSSPPGPILLRRELSNGPQITGILKNYYHNNYNYQLSQCWITYFDTSDPMENNELTTQLRADMLTGWQPTSNWGYKHCSTWVLH